MALQHLHRPLQNDDLRPQFGQRVVEPLLQRGERVVLVVDASGRDRAELTILGIDERGDVLQERDQR